MRIVLDTNVLLAGVATHGLCGALVTLCYRDHTVVLSEHILRELGRHYRGKLKANADQVEYVLTTLRSQSEMVKPAKVRREVFEDVDDLPVIGTAVAGRADCLATGDQALLALGEYAGIPIVPPRGLYERIRGG